MSGLGMNSKKVTKEDLLRVDPLAARQNQPAPLNQEAKDNPSFLFKGGQGSENKVQHELKTHDVEAASTATKAAATPKPSLLSSVHNKVNSSEDRATDFRIMLATMKAYEPLLSAATINGGDQNMPDSVNKMITEVDRLTEALCKLSGTDYKDPAAQWMVSQYRKIAADQVGLQWKAFTGNKESFSVDTSILAFEAMNNAAKAYPDVQKYPELTDSLRLQMSCMKSIVPITREYAYLENYIGTMLKGYSVKKETFEIISNEIFDRAMQFTSSVVTDPSDLKSKMFVMQSSMEQASSIYMNALMGEINQFIESCERMEFKDKQQHLLNTVKQNANVIDLKKVSQCFEESFGYLTTLIKKAPMRFAVNSSYTTPSV